MRTKTTFHPDQNEWQTGLDAARNPNGGRTMRERVKTCASAFKWRFSRNVVEYAVSLIKDQPTELEGSLEVVRAVLEARTIHRDVVIRAPGVAVREEK